MDGKASDIQTPEAPVRAGYFGSEKAKLQTTRSKLKPRYHKNNRTGMEVLN